MSAAVRQQLPAVPGDNESNSSALQSSKGRISSQRMPPISGAASVASAGDSGQSFERRPSTAAITAPLSRGASRSASELACQVLVTDYEGDKRDLERELERFGTIVRMEVKRRPIMRARPDVSTFIGTASKPIRGENRVNLIADRVVSLADAAETDPAIRTKALSSCQCAILSKLSKEQIRVLADGSIVAKPKDGQELFVEADEIEYLYIIAKGIYKIFQEVDGKEVLLGTISGAGQIVGERDFLASKPHSVTMLAEVEGTVIAIPAHAVEDILTKKEDVQNYLQDLYKSRQVLLDVLCSKRCSLTKLLHSDESNYLTDVAATIGYPRDPDGKGSFLTELYDCVSAIVVFGEIRVEVHEHDNLDEKETKVQIEEAPRETKVQIEELRDDSTERKTRVLTSGMAIEDVVKLKNITDRTVATISVTEATEIMVVCHEDLEPLLANNFALRAYMENLGAPEGGRDGFRRREQNSVLPPAPVWLHIQPVSLICRHQADPVSVVEMPRAPSGQPFQGSSTRTGPQPFATISEYTHPHIVAVQECWKFQKHDPEEMSEAPFFWNRTSIKSFTEEWLRLLSDAEVCVTYSSAVEAVGAVRELETMWNTRFPSAKLAGHSHGYQLLRQRFVERIRACDYNWIAAEQVVSEMESHGVSEDASIWHEFGKIYNSSYPIQIEKAYTVSERLADCLSIGSEYLLDTLETWTSYGYSAWASRLVDRCVMRDVVVPDTAYSYLVTGWIREKDTEMALQSIKKMWSRNILPETSLVNKLIALFVDLNQMEEAVQVLTELESAGADEGPEPTKHTYLLVLSGLVTLGDGERVKDMVSRMLTRLQEHNSTMLMNFVVESWCISGRMKKAKKFVSTFQKSSMCQVNVSVVDAEGNRSVEKCRCCPRADEHTYAILAAGWASVGNAEVAAEAFLAMAEMDLDSSKIDMNLIAQYWKSGKRRQVKGYEIPVPEVKKCKASPVGLPVPLPPPERSMRGESSPVAGSKGHASTRFATSQGSKDGGKPHDTTSKAVPQHKHR